MSKPIVLVTGGRDYADRARVYAVLDEVQPGLVIEGGARGADTIARAWCMDRGVHVVEVPALWERDRKAAGPKRNTAMVRIATMLWANGASVLVVAFPGGTGTADCVRKARAARLDVREVEA